MTRTRSLFAAAVLALTAPLAIAGCGGDDDGGDPQEIVDAILNNDEQASSGVLDLSFDASAGSAFNLSASLGGPFQGDPEDPTALPQLDLTASAQGQGSGQSLDFEGSLTITEDNAFVGYQGQAYELGAETFGQLKQAIEASAAQTQEQTEGEDVGTSFREGCEQAVEAQGGDPAACDFELSGWFTNLTDEGTEDVEGASTNHVSGDIDVAQMIEDFTGLAQTFPGAEQLDTSQIAQVDEAITEASFDIYGGEDDDILRQLDLSVSIDPTAIEDAQTPPGVDAVDIAFSFVLSEVNEDQTIEGPSDAQPIDELLNQLGLGGLGGLGALGGGGLGDLGGGSLEGGGGGGLGGGGGSTDAYFECVAQAGGDAQAIEECQSEL